MHIHHHAIHQRQSTLFGYPAHHTFRIDAGKSFVGFRRSRGRRERESGGEHSRHDLVTHGHTPFVAGGQSTNHPASNHSSAFVYVMYLRPSTISPTRCTEPLGYLPIIWNTLPKYTVQPFSSIMKAVSYS